ncbi:hypothetical protein ES703_13467 [subsurface metagenome]
MIINKLKTFVFLIFFCSTLGVFAAGDQEPGQLVEAGEEPSEIGLVIVRVLEDSPAEKAGLVRGDVLLKIKAQPVYTIQDVYDAMEDSRAGETISLLIQHGDEVRTVSLRLEDRLFRPPIGVEFAHPRLAHWGDLELHRSGALVIKILENSPADKAGLKRWDLICSVDGVEIGDKNGLAEIIAGYKPGDQVTIKVLRRGRGDLDIAVGLEEGENGQAFLGLRFMPVPAAIGRLPHFIPRRFFERERRWRREAPRFPGEGRLPEEIRPRFHPRGPSN